MSGVSLRSSGSGGQPHNLTRWDHWRVAGRQSLDRARRELLALRWPDVDLDRASLRVVASLIRIVGQEPQLAEPKSRRLRRQVELSAAAVDALRRHRAKAPSIGFVTWDFSNPSAVAKVVVKRTAILAHRAISGPFTIEVFVGVRRWPPGQARSPARA